MDTVKKEKIKKFEAPIIDKVNGKVSITSLPGAVIRYTRNGKWPNLASPVYTEPFEVSLKDKEVIAKAWRGDEESFMAVEKTRIPRTLKLCVMVLEEDDEKQTKATKKKAKNQTQPKADGSEKDKKKKLSPNYQKVMDSIREFRWVASSACSKVVLAGLAASTWNKKGYVEGMKRSGIDAALGGVFCKKNDSNPIEEYIKQQAPDWMSILRQECRRLIDKALTTSDPDNGKRMDHNIYNQIRSCPQFGRVGLPIVCCYSSEGGVKWINERTIGLRWNNKIGELQFRILGKRTKSDNGNISYGLEPYQIGIIKLIQSGEYQQGLTTITEEDGRLMLLVTYSMMPKINELNDGRTMELAFTDNPLEFMKAKIDSGSDDQSEVDLKWSQTESAAAAVDLMKRSEAQKQYIENIRKACGSHRDRKSGSGTAAGYHAARERGERLSLQRQNTGKTYNNMWSFRVINWAMSRKCGRIIVHGMPASLFGYPWQWADFKFQLESKSKREGIKISFVEATTIGVQDIIKEEN